MKEITTRSTIRSLLAHPRSAVRAFAHVATTNRRILELQERDALYHRSLARLIRSSGGWAAARRGLLRRAQFTSPAAWLFRDLVVVGRACGLRPSQVLARVPPVGFLALEDLESAPFPDPAILEFRLRAAVVQRGRELGTNAHAILAANQIDETRRKTWLHWPPQPWVVRDSDRNTGPAWGSGYRILTQPTFTFRCVEHLFGLDLGAALCVPAPGEPAPACRFTLAP